MTLRDFALGCVLLLSANLVQAAPNWSLNTSAVTDPAILGEASAVIRLSETSVVVDSDGTFLTERRTVMELLRNESWNAANSESYNAASDKVLEADAWIVRNGAEVEHKSKSSWTDVMANAEGVLIDETRRIVIDLRSKAVKGDLVVFCTKIRSKEFLGDQFFDYNSDVLPKVNRSVRITLPAGWTATHRHFGTQTSTAYSRAGNVSTWVLPNTVYVDEESYSAPAPSGLVVSLKSPNGQILTFENWLEVGQYINRLQSPQCDTSAELKIKVRAISSSLSDEILRIGALGRYVQDLRYVAINRNLSIGHGYRPRLASEVFKTGYGDCKDKACLLRSMLREIGINSHLVAVWNAPGASIDENIATPVWFNHAILAIELASVPEAWRSAVITEGGKTYLIFDPTNRLTVMGDIADALQGSRAFLSGDSGGVMVSLPVRDGEAGFSLKRQMTVSITRDSVAKCTGSILSNGQVAASLRSWIESSGRDLDLEKLIQYQMADRFRLAAISDKKYHDDLIEGSSRLDFTCVLPGFLQSIPGNKAVVKFDLFSSKAIPAFPAKDRYKPIRFTPLVIRDEVKIELESGLAITDLPKPAELQSPYGKYSLQISRDGSGVIMIRHYEIFRQIVPVEDYAKVKQYLNAVAKADRSAAILRTDG